MRGLEGFNWVLKWISGGIEVVGIVIIVMGAILTIVFFLQGLFRGDSREACYHKFRSDFGKAILLGLEFLVASDIVGTVAIGPTLQDLSVLGLLVLIRTFLSFALEVEVSGRWPWQGSKVEKGST